MKSSGPGNKSYKSEPLLTALERAIARKELIFTIYEAGDIISCPRSFFQKSAHILNEIRECKLNYLQKNTQIQSIPSTTPPLPKRAKR